MVTWTPAPSRAPELPVVPALPATRTSFAFSATAEHAACLTTGSQGGLVPEHRSFDGPSSRRRTLALEESLRTQPLPTEDGRLLLLRGAAGRHELVLADPETGRAGERLTVERLTVECRALRLVASAEPGTLALAVRSDSPGRSTLYRVLDSPLRWEPVAALPGTVGRICGLEHSGRLLGVALRHESRSRTVLVDLTDGSHHDLPCAPGREGDALLLASPSSGLLLMATDTPQGRRLAWRSLADPAGLRAPERLNTIDGAVLPLAFDPAGERVALRVLRGARARLLVYDLRQDRLTEVPLAAGAVQQVAGWGRSGLLVPVSTADRPAEIAVLSPEATTEWAPAGSQAAGRSRVERFSGPAGQFEAVCQGDWRSADAVLVALHGGPEAAWDLGYEPVLHRLATAGIAVVAPNQRGSTGYGAAHAEALHGAWGGPDLADIRALVRALAAGRPGSAPPPMLYGVSYGAHLALLAAAADPQLWSRCAVVAPFLSAARLHAQASPAVRALIDRLGGRTEVEDGLGPRDLWTLADRIRTPLMIVHGTDDRTIPVDQSRQLRQRLLDTGRSEGTHFRYAEVPGGGHSPLENLAGAHLREQLVEFLSQRPGNA